MKISRSEIKKLLRMRGKDQKALHNKASNVRKKNIGDEVHFRGIIEFSNICEKNCYYCGIRKNNKKINRYRMTLNEIKDCLDFIRKANYGSTVIQSGELTSDNSKKYLIKIMELINKNYPELGVTLSCGELDYDFLKKLRNFGAHRYLLRIETSVPKLYKKLHPSDHSLKNRIKCLGNLKKLGFQVGCGNMIGIPGQSIDDMVDDLEFFINMDCDMFGLGPYVIHKDTPIATQKNCKWWEKNKNEIFSTTLNYLAILRLLMPTCNIATATALDVFTKEGRIMALKAGANIIMPSVTPNKYRNDYLLYQNKPCVDGHAHICSHCSVKKARTAGLKPIFGKQGNSLHYYNRINCLNEKKDQ